MNLDAQGTEAPGKTELDPHAKDCTTTAQMDAIIIDKYSNMYEDFESTRRPWDAPRIAEHINAACKTSIAADLVKRRARALQNMGRVSCDKLFDTQRKNLAMQLLIQLGVSDENSFEPFHPHSRDNFTVGALKCSKSGCIIMDSTTHAEHAGFYEDRQTMGYWQTDVRRNATLKCLADDKRRMMILHEYVEGKDWLDVGCGAGGILDLLKHACNDCAGVEPQQHIREALVEDGHDVFRYVEEMDADRMFDVISAFHVVEHLPDPIDVLTKIYDRLRPGGMVVFEVPHARDFLLEEIKCDAFADFTLWSEHLILHTRESLTRLVQSCGFKRCTVKGEQRYPPENHMYWLRHGKPGGHVQMEHLQDPLLTAAYAAMLEKNDMTDTLIIFAYKDP